MLEASVKIKNKTPAVKRDQGIKRISFFEKGGTCIGDEAPQYTVAR
jgi:hypothetical protein